MPAARRDRHDVLQHLAPLRHQPGVRPTLLRLRGSKLVDEAISTAAWAIDDSGLLKCGIWSPCVARQYTGTAGKVTNCQVAVSVSMVTDTAS